MKCKILYHFFSIVILLVLLTLLVGCQLTSCQDIAGPGCYFSHTTTRFCCIGHLRHRCPVEVWRSTYVTGRNYYRNVWIGSCVPYSSRCQGMIDFCP